MGHAEEPLVLNASFALTETITEGFRRTAQPDSAKTNGKGRPPRHRRCRPWPQAPPHRFMHFADVWPWSYATERLAGRLHSQRLLLRLCSCACEGRPGRCSDRHAANMRGIQTRC